MKRFLYLCLAVFTIINCNSCTQLEPLPAGKDEDASDLPEEGVEGDLPETFGTPLTCEEILELGEIGVPMEERLFRITTLEELIAGMKQSSVPAAFATVECVGVHYYILVGDKPNEFGHPSKIFQTTYDLKIIDLHEVFHDYPYDVGDVFTIDLYYRYATRVIVEPFDCESICYTGYDENGFPEYTAGLHEWIPTSENCERVTILGYYNEIPLNVGEQYIGRLIYSGPTDSSLTYETPISENSHYVIHEGYGIGTNREEVCIKIAQELVEYVRDKESK